MVKIVLVTLTIRLVQRGDEFCEVVEGLRQDYFRFEHVVRCTRQVGGLDPRLDGGVKTRSV